MATKLLQLTKFENAGFSANRAHNQWVEIFDAAKQALARQPSKGPLYTEYEAELADGIVKILNGGYDLDMRYGYDSANARRESLHKLLKTGSPEKLYAALESQAMSRGEVSLAYKTLQTELKLAQAVELTASETAVMESSVAVENLVAKRALALLEGGAIVAAGYGVGAATLVVGVKAWLDQLPETDLPSDEILALKQYVEQHGPDHANDHTLDQYMQNAEPAP